MTALPDLKQLTNEAKDGLILALWEELQKLQKKKPKKTSKNSSLPPAKGFKAEVKREEKESGQNLVILLANALPINRLGCQYRLSSPPMPYDL